MVIFYSYVSLPEGKTPALTPQSLRQEFLESHSMSGTREGGV